MQDVLSTLKILSDKVAELPAEDVTQLASNLFHLTRDVVNLSNGDKTVPLRLNTQSIHELAAWAVIAVDVVEHGSVDGSEVTEHLADVVTAAAQLSKSLARIQQVLKSKSKSN